MIPTSSTAAPGRMESAVTRPGTPAAATMMSALARCAREVAGAGVAERDGGVLAAPGEEQPEGTSHRHATTDDDHLGAGDRHVVAAEQLDDAPRRARQRRRLTEHQASEVHRVQTVGVLVRVHQRQHRVRVEPLGQRQLDDVAGAGRDRR